MLLWENPIKMGRLFFASQRSNQALSLLTTEVVENPGTKSMTFTDPPHDLTSLEPTMYCLFDGSVWLGS